MSELKSHTDQTDSAETPRGVIGVHHVAYACRDLHETVKFYEDLMGMPLVNTEVARFGKGYFRHVFFDSGDGTCVAFFDLHGVGEKPEWSTSLSESTGTPLWVNHLALRSDAARQVEVRDRMLAAGIEPTMIIDHDWSESHYYTDPNGILVELCRDTPSMPISAEAAHAALDDVPAGIGAS